MRSWLERAAKGLSTDESGKVAKTLVTISRNAEVLEVGCGFGRKLRLLRSLGFSRLCGVDKNPAVAAAARDAGFEAFDAATFETQWPGQSCDLLVLSHLVEHFTPEALYPFLNHWLRRLRVGGHLLLLSPMPGDDFYLDFDHVKPYLPQGFKDFFGQGDEQVGAYSPHVLKLRDLHYRRSPLRLRHLRCMVLKTPWAVVPRSINLASAVAFRLSGTVIGRSSGWVALFRKKAGPVVQGDGPL